VDEIEFITETICQGLERRMPLVLVSLIIQQGSTPRHGSTKMVVRTDGEYGTIGGSLLEATAIRESRNALSQAKSKIIAFELSGKDVTAAGMICGGRAEVLLDYIPPTNENIEFFCYWRDAFKRGEEFFFLTHLKGTEYTIEVTGHTILYSDGRQIGEIPLEPDDSTPIREELHNVSGTTVFSLGGKRVVIDPIRKLKTMYCFGAGHVAVPTAHIAAQVGFRVVIIDDRAEFANAERFPDASKTLVVDDFNQAFDDLEVDLDSYIVIVTRGHQYDRAVLEQALKSEAGYIGMISSRRKREAIYEALMNKGVTREQLMRVHSPIGINIAAETPAEIGVSIVAELINERAKQQA
jgi:xanthine dehydrogenase accessory factor